MCSPFVQRSPAARYPLEHNPLAVPDAGLVTDGIQTAAVRVARPRHVEDGGAGADGAAAAGVGQVRPLQLRAASTAGSSYKFLFAKQTNRLQMLNALPDARNGGRSSPGPPAAGPAGRIPGRRGGGGARTPAPRAAARAPRPAR